MKSLKYILLLLLILIIGFSVYVAVQPNDYKFSRSRTIEAPVSLLYNKVNDFKEWPEFSPWIEQEKDAKLTYSENTSGEGASYSWNGEILGEGSMTTLDTEKNKAINQKIEFIKPFEAQSNINWYFEPTEKGTKVTWEMEGKQDFMTKLYTTFAGSIESGTGPDFERGLFKLDSITNAEMKVYSINIDGVTQHSGGYYLYNTTSCKFSEFETKMKEMMPKVGAYAMTNNITMAGSPFVLYHKWDEENNAVIFSCCIPTNSRVITEDSDILTGKLDSFNALKTTLKGNYDNLEEAWNKSMEYINTNNLVMLEAGPMLETYVTDPMNHPNPADWITEIYIAVE
ncbi:GyrI-like domain-containing protein [Winogradskyella sp. SYSU M77433]|uniref:SRPBCC family protein n=1 Tax=Winogradskyella sp. SYSU M77433 TaxID=3042722 RepID=UPI00247FF182|nr:GyrI-like domain-containing protein [Winogradskyella sp. SYSU M77433]MDH7911218.1 GyrI-like domain-containing protein [Winogradskyella sp. SYSU M77433]